MELIEVVVYLTEDYSEAESIWVEKGSSKEDIRKKINKQYKVWYYFDILDK